MDENPYESPDEPSPGPAKSGCLILTIPLMLSVLGAIFTSGYAERSLIGTGVGLSLGFILVYIVRRRERQ